MIILKIIITLYLAGVIFNALQMARAYKNASGKRMSLSEFLYGLYFMFIRPRHVFYGTIRAIQNWRWLDDRIEMDEDGKFVLTQKEND